MPAVLVIDDDRELAELLAQSLRQEGFSLRAVHTGEEGIRQLEAEPPDLVLLDVTMPGINGFETLRRIRRQSDVPVIRSTARREEVDRIVGLEIGADDYLAKPFSVRELAARMQAIVRRVKKGAPVGERREIQLGALWMDLLTRCVKVAGETIHLTTGEFDLLRALMESPAVALSRETLSKHVLGRITRSMTAPSIIWCPRCDASWAAMRVAVSASRRFVTRVTFSWISIRCAASS